MCGQPTPSQYNQTRLLPEASTRQPYFSDAKWTWVKSQWPCKVDGYSEK